MPRITLFGLVPFVALFLWSAACDSRPVYPLDDEEDASTDGARADVIATDGAIADVQTPDVETPDAADAGQVADAADAETPNDAALD